MYDAGDYLYVHYGDLYKGFELRIDVDAPQKPLPCIKADENIRESQWLHDQEIVYVLTSETVDDLGHSFLFSNPDDIPAVAGTETTIVHVERRDLLLPAYLNYVLQTKRFKLLLRQYVKGMKVFRVHPDDLSRIEIDLPPLSAQKKTVALLDMFYDLQRASDKQNRKLEQICKTMFNALNSDDENPLVELSEIAYINPIRTIKKGAKAPCVEMANLSTTGPIPSEWSMRFYGGGCKFTNGDTIMARITPCLENGKAGYINFLKEGQVAFGSTEYIVLSTKGVLPPEYFYFLVRNPAFISYAVARMNGTSGRQRVSGSDIGSFQIRMPNNRQICDFEKVVGPAMEAILANSIAKRQVGELRDALLQKTIWGDVDVSEIRLEKQG